MSALYNAAELHLDNRGLTWRDADGNDICELRPDGFYFIRDAKERRVYPKRQYRWRPRTLRPSSETD